MESLLGKVIGTRDFNSPEFVALLATLSGKNLSLWSSDFVIALAAARPPSAFFARVTCVDDCLHSPSESP